jgi:Tol biopolymer transport system component
MPNDDELKQRFDDESSRVDVPPLDAARLAGRAARRRRLRTSIRVSAVGLALIGVLSVTTLVRRDGGEIELVQPAAGSSFGPPLANSLAPSHEPSLTQNPRSTASNPDPKPPLPERRVDPAISADGRFVAFSAGEVFVFDRQAGKRETVSVTVSGKRIDGDKPQISHDGRFVAFVGENGIVYVRDRTARTTSVVSMSTGGQAVTVGAQEPSISMSGDGRFVAFSGASASLVEGDTNAVEDVFVRDLTEGTTRRVSASSTGEQANGRSAFPDISSDGRSVAFQSYATNLSSGEHPQCNSGVCPQIYVHDRDSGTTSLVSISSSGEVADKGARHPTISADARSVAFDSVSTNLAASKPDSAAHDIFVRDLSSGETREVSGEHDCNCVFPFISDDGSSVAYGTSSLGLWIHDVADGSERRVASYGLGTVGFSADGLLIAYRAGDGRIVILDQADGKKVITP